MPLHITTTLYDLIAALQEVTALDEGELVVALVTHWLRMGRITFLNNVSRRMSDRWRTLARPLPSKRRVVPILASIVP
jgi:hypothetical protein